MLSGQRSPYFDTALYKIVNAIGEPIELFLVPASAPRQRPLYVLSCLWDCAYKRTLAVNRKE